LSRWRDARAWAPALVCLACLLRLGLPHVSPAAQGDAPATGAQLSDEARGDAPAASAQLSDEARGDAPVTRAQLSDGARALLGELAVGEHLMGWTVEALDGPRDGMLRIDLGRDDVRFALLVARKGTRAEAAPLETERYAIFYGHVHPPETTLSDDTIHATTHALARRIRAHEATVDVPGM
jgi:hypothetical protein